MASKNQNKPPSSVNLCPLSRKNCDVDEGLQVDKRRKITIGNMVRGANTGRNRPVLVPVNSGLDATPKSGPASIADSDCGVIEFTKEDIEALLNEKVKPTKKYDLKEKSEILLERVKKLRLCIKWLQELERNYILEQEKLQNMLQLAEKKCNELEMMAKDKEEELNSLIMELRRNYASVQEKLVKEETDKLAVVDSLTSEKEARHAAERLQRSLTEDLGKAQEELATTKLKVSSANEMFKRTQEYNTSLQQYNSKLQTELATTNDILKQVEKEKASLMQNLGTLRGHYNSLQDQLVSSRSLLEEATKQKETMVTEVTCLRGELQQVRDDRDRQNLQVQALTTEVAKFQESTGKSHAQFDLLIAQTNQMEVRCASQSDQIRMLQNELAAAQQRVQISDVSVIQTKTDYEEQKRLTVDLQTRLAEAEFKIMEGERVRKKLHNTILELKGNIRVFCRVRPPLPDDGPGIDTKFISYPTSTEYLGRGITLMQNGQQHSFTFDKVLLPDTSQGDVFIEISQLIQSALDGYKVCIFAYGQTGSGKTYTMMGRPGNAEQKGLIPRSLEQIFQTRESLQTQGWKYEMQVSMLEIYNETIRDLLSPNKLVSDGKQYAIKHDANGNTVVSDLTIVDVCSSKEVAFLLDQAAQSRSVGKTQMNEQSSRSHFVFTLRISGVNESTEQQVQGVLNLIDLAGSERLSRSGATGDRLKETQAINKSLSSLSDVIFSLAKKEDHVPFRNSKLTYLLQPCLGGDSKTLMFVNVSPEPSSLGESLCSLRFAARVNACEIGIPRRQTSIRSADSRLSCG